MPAPSLLFKSLRPWGSVRYCYNARVTIHVTPVAQLSVRPTKYKRPFPQRWREGTAAQKFAELGGVSSSRRLALKELVIGIAATTGRGDLEVHGIAAHGAFVLGDGFAILALALHFEVNLVAVDFLPVGDLDRLGWSAATATPPISGGTVTRAELRHQP